MEPDYDYDEVDHYDGRILWGRIAVYGVAFLLVFLMGSCWGARGGPDEDEVADLESQVSALQDENRELRETVDAMSAGQPQEPEPTPTPDETADTDDETTDETDEPRTYTVQSGDTLRGIAADVYGDPNLWELIADANGLTRETVLTVGQELVIPPSEEADA